MNTKRNIIIFDRDNTLIKDKGYTFKIKDLKFFPGVIKALALLNRNKIKIFVVTNQSGIAKGYFKKKDMFLFHKLMNKILIKNFSKIEHFYYCPHHINGIIKKYKKKCNCRKPNIQLLKKIKHKYKNAKILMIGDKKTDYLAAKKAKIIFFYKKKNFYKQIQNLVKKYF